MKIIEWEVSFKAKTNIDAFIHKNYSDRDDHVEIMDRQDGRYRAIQFLDDRGDLDDRDDHMETRLFYFVNKTVAGKRGKPNIPFNIFKIQWIPAIKKLTFAI